MDYMPVDPMAPADSPLHPSRLAQARLGELIPDPADVEREELQHLIDKHRTAAEVEAEIMPERFELDQREAIVVITGNGDKVAELVDLTGAAYRWAVTEDDPGHWERVESPAPEVPEAMLQGSVAGPTPPTTGGKTPADLDAALAALNAVKGA